MQYRLLREAPERSFVVVFDTDDEVNSGLLKFAKQENLTSSHFTAIGAFRSVKLGYFDLDQKDYLEIPVEEQVEVLSLVGNIVLHKDEPKLHAHVVVGRRDGSTRGGHLLGGKVRPTLEVMVVEEPKNIERQIDQATGLPLIRI